MRQAVVLNQQGLLVPTKERVEYFLRYFAGALEKENIRAFEALRRRLPIMSSVYGFFIDVVPLISACLHSENSDMVLGALDLIEVIVNDYGKELGKLSLTRLLKDLFFFRKVGSVMRTFVKNVFFRIVQVCHDNIGYPLRRLIAGDEGIQLEIFVLLLEYVTTTNDVNPVGPCCCIAAQQGLLCSSSQVRLAAFDLLYVLYDRGYERDVLVKCFPNRNGPGEVLAGIQTRLQHRYKLPLALDDLMHSLIMSCSDVAFRIN